MTASVGIGTHGIFGTDMVHMDWSCLYTAYIVLYQIGSEWLAEERCTFTDIPNHLTS